jgi:primase-polymerase (primpol)-like protein
VGGRDFARARYADFGKRAAFSSPTAWADSAVTREIAEYFEFLGLDYSFDEMR